jgi:hypothetical protein
LVLNVIILIQQRRLLDPNRKTGALIAGRVQGPRCVEEMEPVMVVFQLTQRVPGAKIQVFLLAGQGRKATLSLLEIGTSGCLDGWGRNNISFFVSGIKS